MGKWIRNRQQRLWAAVIVAIALFWIPIAIAQPVVPDEMFWGRRFALSSEPRALEAQPRPTDHCPVPVSTDNLLAVNWQPAFCQTHQEKPECQSQDASDFDANHFTLHGLWPQPPAKAYCCLPSNFPKEPWSSQPNFDHALAEETLTLLRDGRRMPGVASFLHRHEWYKHGTCYNPSSDTPEQEYFEEALALLKQLNHSSVQRLFASRIGKRLSLVEIRAAFNQAFGPGAGNKVNLKCKGRLIHELWINLAGDIQADSQLATLLAPAKDAQSQCRSGRVDPVGFSL